MKYKGVTFNINGQKHFKVLFNTDPTQTGHADIQHM